MVLEYINACQSASKQLEATDEVGVNFLDQLDVACLTLHLNGFRELVREGFLTMLLGCIYDLSSVLSANPCTFIFSMILDFCSSVNLAAEVT